MHPPTRLAGRGGVPTALLLAFGLALVPSGCTDAARDARAAEGDGVSQDDLGSALVARLDTLSDATIDSVYARPATPLWVDDGGLTATGRSALDALTRGEAEGIATTRYGVDELRALEADRSSTQSDLARLEVDITRALSLFTRDLALGVVASTGFEPGWELDSLDNGALPAAPANGEAVLDRLNTLRPQTEQYGRLQDVLASLGEIREQGGWPAVRLADGTFQVGDSAAAVGRLRARLLQSASADERRLAAEGGQRPERFDAALGQSLSSFQGRHDIELDGVLGPGTAEQLDVPVEARITEVELALERWRWLPADLGPLAVVVNTPERRVHVVQDGAVTLSMKSIIGQRDWRTALFQDEMEEIVVNPYWNIPETILGAETLPKALADADYLRENDFEVVDPETGEVVPLEDVRWDEVAIDSIAPDSTVVRGFPYRIRQRPGGKNALGTMKFMFPNEHAIYLHDTPADHLFHERLRTFSHGCVRLERPVELAHLLLRESSSHSPSEFDSLLASGEEHVLLLEPVPVYLIYQTVWVDESGAPTFTPDVYDRNTEARQALASAMAPPVER